MGESTRGPGDDRPDSEADDLDIELFPQPAVPSPEEGDGSRGGAPPAGTVGALQRRPEGPGTTERLPEVYVPLEVTDEDTLVIEADDLAEPVRPPVRGQRYDAGGPLPSVDASHLAGGPAKKGKGDLLSGGLIGSLLLQMLLAGAVGGFLAWAAIEPATRANEQAPMPETVMGWLVDRSLIGGALGGLIAMALGAVEGLVVGVASRAAAGAGLGLLIGGAGGALGFIFGQRVYDMILLGGDPNIQMGVTALQILARAVAWSVLGAFIGLGPGVMMMSTRKMLNGIIGGLAGGFIGGLLFDPIGLVFEAIGGMGGTPSRFVGTIVLGMCTGAGIGIAEEVRKEAWLVIASGPLAGKQFIIYKPVTWLGSSPGMDIPLIKDPDVAPKHCTLEMAGASCFVRSAGGQVFVNGQPAAAQRLGSGDVIQLGGTVLEYYTRPFATGPGLGPV